MYVTVLVLLIILYISLKWLKWHFSPYRKLPSPPGWPIIGHFMALQSEDVMTVFRGWAEKYKNEGLFYLNLSAVKHRPMVVICKPEHQKRVLSRPDKYPRQGLLKETLPLTGNGLLIATGEEHRQQKKLLQKAFSRLQVKKYLPAFNRHMSIMIQSWISLINGNESGVNIDIKDYTSNMTFDIIGEVAFGWQFNSQYPEKIAPVIHKLKKTTTSGSLQTKNILLMRFFPWLRYMPFGPGKTMREFDKEFDMLLDKILRTRREKMANNSLTIDEKNDLLSMMMEAKDDESEIGFTDQLIKDNTYSFLLAGHETTATALPAIMYYFTQFPELQEICRKEVLEAVGDKDYVEYEDIAKLNYLSAFIKESIRLFPPLTNARYTTEDEMFGDYLIPKDTSLFLQTQISNVHTDSFDNPMEFRPERYLQAEGKVGMSFTFGYGPYNCIGKHFAMFEMQLVMARLLKHFNFRIDADKANFLRRLNVAVVCVPPMQLRVSLLNQ